MARRHFDSKGYPKLKEIIMTSKIGICFRKKEYERLIEKNIKQINKNFLLINKYEEMNEINVRNIAAITARFLLRSPDAIGRSDFFGCFLSLSISITSFIR